MRVISNSLNHPQLRWSKSVSMKLLSFNTDICMKGMVNRRGPSFYTIYVIEHKLLGGRNSWIKKRYSLKKN